jgi:hypothetical protein
VKLQELYTNKLGLSCAKLRTNSASQPAHLAFLLSFSCHLRLVWYLVPSKENSGQSGRDSLIDKISHFHLEKPLSSNYKGTNLLFTKR